MNGLFEAALEVQQFMQARRWASCVIGGIAMIRLTQLCELKETPDIIARLRQLISA